MHSNVQSPPLILPHENIASLMETEDYENDDLIAYNIANFNHLAWAIETIFVMITLEGWSLLMYNLMDASMSFMAIAYCVLLVVFGSFFLLNVILAVIMESFDRVDRSQWLIEEQKKNLIKAQKRACGIETSSSESDNEQEGVAPLGEIDDEGKDG